MTIPIWSPVNVFRGNTPDDSFGASVSMSSDGTTVAIGTPYIEKAIVSVYKWDEDIEKWTQFGNNIKKSRTMMKQEFQ